MQVTPEEAKDMYCPMYSTRARSNCEASECMWWVWTEYKSKPYGSGIDKSKPIRGTCAQTLE